MKKEEDVKEMTAKTKIEKAHLLTIKKLGFGRATNETYYDKVFHEILKDIDHTN